MCSARLILIFLSLFGYLASAQIKGQKTGWEWQLQQATSLKDRIAIVDRTAIRALIDRGENDPEYKQLLGIRKAECVKAPDDCFAVTALAQYTCLKDDVNEQILAAYWREIFKAVREPAQARSLLKILNECARAQTSNKLVLLLELLDQTQMNKKLSGATAQAVQVIRGFFAAKPESPQHTLEILNRYVGEALGQSPFPIASLRDIFLAIAPWVDAGGAQAVTVKEKQNLLANMELILGITGYAPRYIVTLSKFDLVKTAEGNLDWLLGRTGNLMMIGDPMTVANSLAIVTQQMPSMNAKQKVWADTQVAYAKYVRGDRINAVQEFRIALGKSEIMDGMQILPWLQFQLAVLEAGNGDLVPARKNIEAHLTQLRSNQQLKWHDRFYGLGVLANIKLRAGEIAQAKADTDKIHSEFRQYILGETETGLWLNVDRLVIAILLKSEASRKEIENEIRKQIQVLPAFAYLNDGLQMISLAEKKADYSAPMNKLKAKLGENDINYRYLAWVSGRIAQNMKK